MHLDEGGDDDEPGVGHRPRHLGHAADVLDAAYVGEAEVAVQAVAQVVAVQHVDRAGSGVQPLRQ